MPEDRLIEYLDRIDGGGWTPEGDAHGKSDAELIRRAIKEFDERVALERARWGR